ncbi:hypothetical protein RFM41_30465, partial [Mesorhizobium sp. VK25A]
NIDDRCYRRSLASALLRSALASGFVTAELHHSAGHDLLETWADMTSAKNDDKRSLPAGHLP